MKSGAQLNKIVIRIYGTESDDRKTEVVAPWGLRTGADEQTWACAAKQHATGLAHAQIPNRPYSRPEVRKRITGSVIGIDCRLKIQRATAIPNAA